MASAGDTQFVSNFPGVFHSLWVWWIALNRSGDREHSAEIGNVVGDGLRLNAGVQLFLREIDDVRAGCRVKVSVPDIKHLDAFRLSFERIKSTRLRESFFAVSINAAAVDLRSNVWLSRSKTLTCRITDICASQAMVPFLRRCIMTVPKKITTWPFTLQHAL